MSWILGPGQWVSAFLFSCLSAFPLYGADYPVKNGHKEATKPREVIPVNKNDLRILERTAEILANSAQWNRNDDRQCPPTATTYSLYCALWKASLEINGEFDHRLGALEELRRTVEERSQGKNYQHRLMDYNNDPSTKLSDLQSAIKETRERLNKRLISRNRSKK